MSESARSSAPEMYRRAANSGIPGERPRVCATLVFDASPAHRRPGSPDDRLHHRPIVIPPAPVSPTQLAVGAGAALLAGFVNAIAGGGTLLTFPALVAAGLSPLHANATSTVALLPGALSSMWGYRDELTGARRWAALFAIPSLVGGALGAVLLLHTPSDAFDRIVPWLVLGATALFLAQRPTPAPRCAARAHIRATTCSRRAPPSLGLLGGQLLVGIYGGYFGAGIGILMLAALGVCSSRNAPSAPPARLGMAKRAAQRRAPVNSSR